MMGMGLQTLVPFTFSSELAALGLQRQRFPSKPLIQTVKYWVYHVWQQLIYSDQTLPQTVIGQPLELMEMMEAVLPIPGPFIYLNAPVLAGAQNKRFLSKPPVQVIYQAYHVQQRVMNLDQGLPQTASAQPLVPMQIMAITLQDQGLFISSSELVVLGLQRQRFPSKPLIRTVKYWVCQLCKQVIYSAAVWPQTASAQWRELMEMMGVVLQTPVPFIFLNAPAALGRQNKQSLRQLAVYHAWKPVMHLVIVWPQTASV